MATEVSWYVVLCQVIIFWTVLPLWIRKAWRYWNFVDTSFTAFTAISWGLALLIIMLWRAYSFADVYIGMELPPDTNSIVMLIIWVVCAAISAMALIVRLRGNKSLEEKS